MYFMPYLSDSSSALRPYFVLISCAPRFAPTAAKLRAFGADALGPEIVARDTWRAANDGSSRLRYAPNARAFLFGRWLLPDRLYMAIVRAVFGLKSGKRRVK
jgi:hypothetical protein